MNNFNKKHKKIKNNYCNPIIIDLQKIVMLFPVNIKYFINT